MRPVPHLDDVPFSIPPAHKYRILSSYEKLTLDESFVQLVSSEDNVPVYSGASGIEPHWARKT